MDFEDQLLAGLIGHHDDIGFFADSNLIADRIDGVLFLVIMQGKIVKPSICEAVAVILNGCQYFPSPRTLITWRGIHFVFFTLAINFAFASVEIDL